MARDRRRDNGTDIRYDSVKTQCPSCRLCCWDIKSIYSLYRLFDETRMHWLRTIVMFYWRRRYFARFGVIKPEWWTWDYSKSLMTHLAMLTQCKYVTARQTNGPLHKPNVRDVKPPEHRSGGSRIVQRGGRRSSRHPWICRCIEI